jgi:Glycosyl transferase 4-like domain/Glycosyl transferases group 1
MGVTSVLYIAWEFPPVNSTGAFRSYRFVKALSEQPDLEISVLTLERNNGAELFHRPIDKSFRDDELKLAHRVEVQSVPPPQSRSKLLNFIRNHFSIIIDTLTDRVLPADKKKIFEFVATKKPDIIIASAPPFSVMKLCLALHKKFNIPYILDMRDLFTLWGGISWPSALHHRLAAKLEEKAYRHAKAVISVTPQVIEILRKGFPKIDAEKFHYIPNSFHTTAKTVGAKGLSDTKKIHLAYVGGYYYEETVSAKSRNLVSRLFSYKTRPNEQWIYRSPYFFLKFISAFLQKNPQYKSRLHFHYFGNSPAYQERFVNEFDLRENFTAHGFLPRTELAAQLKEMSFFIATAEKVLDGEHYCLPSKLAEYLQYEKPVIGFVTKGIQKDFIQNSGMGVCIDPDELEHELPRLEKILFNGFENNINQEYLHQFSIEYCTAQLKKLILQ